MRLLRVGETGDGRPAVEDDMGIDHLGARRQTVVPAVLPAKTGRV